MTPASPDGNEAQKVVDTRGEVSPPSSSELTALIALARLGDWCAEQCSEYTEIDGGSLEDKMFEFGLLEKASEPYDPDKHGDMDMERGETDWNTWTSALRNAREFLEALSKSEASQ